MRVSSYENYDKTIYSINLLQQTMAQRQEQISTGKAFQTMSEDPIRANQLSLVTKSYDRITQYQKNISDAKAYLSQVEGAMGSTVNVLQDTRAKALLAKNGTVSAQDRATYVADIENNIQQVVNLANSQFLGKYVFSGQQTQTVPFSYAGGAVTYNGDNNSLDFRISNTSSVTISEPGSNTFEGVINSMITLRDQIATGDGVQISTALGNFDTEMNKVVDLRSNIGTRMSAADALNEVYQNSKTNLDVQKESVGGVDAIEALLEFTKTQSTYQATIQAMVKMNSVSILNYL